MDSLLFLSSRSAFLFSIEFFIGGLYTNKLFDNHNPHDLLAPLGQEFAHMLSKGLWCLAVGFLILAVIKYVYESQSDRK